MAMRLLLVLGCIVFSGVSLARDCQKWGAAKKIGQLDLSQINEASGLQLSQLVSNRLYHVNDSGDGPFVYYSDLDGSHTKKFAIDQFKPIDVEALGMSSCKGQPCLVVADIGDNRHYRDIHTLHFIKERVSYPKRVGYEKVVEFRYPDYSHDAESIFFTSKGEFILITKEIDHIQQTSEPSYIFKLSAKQLSSARVETLQKIGRLDLSQIMPFWAHQVPTDMSLNWDNDRLLVLNYSSVVEYHVSSDPILGIVLSNPRHIPIVTLNQQESISYTLDGKSFIYDTEARGSNEAAIMQVDCLY